jgi:hypoxanthine phosphoribosyltransferase
MTATKIWLTAEELLADSYRLARLVLESGFRPTHLIGIWRGGAPIGIAVQEFFEFHGLHCDHIAIRTSSYTGIDQQADAVTVHGLGWLAETLTADDRIMLVDDVFDTGRSIASSSL